jgi:hypothetical protein
MKLLKVVLAAAPLLLPALTGCSSEKNESTKNPSLSGLGEVAMQIRLPNGQTISSIDYDITNTTLTSPIEGTIPVDNSPAIRFQRGNIPAGGGYSLALEATTSTGDHCVNTPTTFAVTAGGTTSVMTTLRCGAEVTNGTDAGNVRVNVDVVSVGKTCPVVDGLSAAPLDVYLGGTIALQGYATTASATFGWSVSDAAGTFAPANAAISAFTCTVPGAHIITLSVGATDCPAVTETVPVTCASDGTTPDAGPVVPDAGPVEPDAGPVVPDAGPVVPDAGQDSGPPPGKTCAECRAATPACTSFDGIDITAGCFAAINGDFADSADPLFLQQCIDIVTCAQANECAYNRNLSASGGINYQTLEAGPLGCYCGSKNLDGCIAGPAADAKCRTQWELGARSTVTADVLGNISNLVYPAAWAFYVLDLCDRPVCNNATVGNCTVPGAVN